MDRPICLSKPTLCKLHCGKSVPFFNEKIYLVEYETLPELTEACFVLSGKYCVPRTWLDQVPQSSPDIQYQGLASQLLKPVKHGILLDISNSKNILFVK